MPWCRTEEPLSLVQVILGEGLPDALQCKVKLFPSRTTWLPGADLIADVSEKERLVSLWLSKHV